MKLHSFVYLALQLKPGLSSHKPISKNDFFPPLIRNWLPVIVLEPLLVHQDAYFTSGSSQEEDTAFFLSQVFVCTHAGLYWRLCNAHTTWGQQVFQRQARSHKQPLHFSFAFTIILTPFIHWFHLEMWSPKLSKGRNELWINTSATVQHNLETRTKAKHKSQRRSRTGNENCTFPQWQCGASAVITSLTRCRGQPSPAAACKGALLMAMCSPKRTRCCWEVQPMVPHLGCVEKKKEPSYSFQWKFSTLKAWMCAAFKNSL